MSILVIHDRIPMTRNLPRRSFGTPHVPGNSVVTSRDPSFGLPFDITSVVRSRTSDGRVISKLERHLAKQDSTSEHVGHLRRARIRITSVHRTYVIRDHCLSSAGLTVKVYSPSSGRSNNLTRFSPSIIVATELPKNFDFGFNSPVMSTPFLGEV